MKKIAYFFLMALALTLFSFAITAKQTDLQTGSPVMVGSPILVLNN